MSAAQRVKATAALGALFLSRPVETIAAADVAEVFRSHGLAGEELRVMSERVRSELLRLGEADPSAATQDKVAALIRLAQEGAALLLRGSGHPHESKVSSS